MSQIYELAIVEDRGTFFLVTGVTKNTLDALANRNDKYLKLSYSAYTDIKAGLSDNKIIVINKPLTTDEVMPGDIQMKESDQDDLDILKVIYDKKIAKSLSKKLAKISGLDIINFTMVNNELIQAGFVITNDNREEKYIEIIEKDDEELIEKLELYLNMMDDMQYINSARAECNTAIAKIYECKKESELEPILQEFYEKQNTPLV